MELQYVDQKINPDVEKEIKNGFFEIRKKYSEDQRPKMKPGEEEEVQVYVSHLCLKNYHPIFSK